MINPIGFGKKQREPLPLKIVYASVGRKINVKLSVILNGYEYALKTLTLKAGRHFRWNLFQIFGEGYYEQ